MAVRPNASEHGFNDPISALTFVIESATRPMDERSLTTACFNLARELYFEENFDPGADVFGLIPPEDAVGPLRRKHPILSNCPTHSLYQPQLPVRIPGVYIPPKDAVRHGVTGWVELEVNVSNDGIVETARIVDSSDSRLEKGVIDYVLEFRYPKRPHFDGQFMRRKGLKVRIVIDYFQVAREKGCEWDDPRGERIGAR